MDSTEATTHIGLCAGYGGIELGIKRVIPNLRTVALCEIEAFAIANLVAKMEAGLMDPAPIWPDLKTFPWASFRDRVGLLTGGYPCQPFSAAGKRLGANDPRHLWPFIADGIRAMRPAACFFENVEGHISLGLRAVLSELESIGYRCAWGIFSAAEVGAPHQRKRVFILAHRNGARLEGYRGHVRLDGQEGRKAADGYAWPSRPGQPQHPWEPPRVAGNAKGGNGQRGTPRDTGHTPQPDKAMGDPTLHDGGGGSVGSETWRPVRPGGRDTQCPLGGDADGNSGRLDYAKLCVSGDNRTDELRLCGNGVVPATAERAFRTLLAELP
jgi:DNA (cytosine-5)-methyltransferase 1